MQMTGTFPELNAGRKKAGAKRKAAPCPESANDALGGFSVKRMPRPINAPKSFAGRRDASHRKARGL